MTDTQKPRPPGERDDLSDEPHELPEATAPELAAAASLREALECWTHDEPCATTASRAVASDVELIASIRHAVRPTAIAPERHEAILAQALGRHAVGLHALRDRNRARSDRAMDRAKRNLGPFAFAATAGLALAAAGFLLVLHRTPDATQPSVPLAGKMPAPMIPCRSAAGLFEAEWSAGQGTTERVDRIASARERDLRDNLFAQWQVR